MKITELTEGAREQETRRESPDIASSLKIFARVNVNQDISANVKSMCENNEDLRRVIVDI